MKGKKINDFFLFEKKNQTKHDAFKIFLKRIMFVQCELKYKQYAARQD